MRIAFIRRPSRAARGRRHAPRALSMVEVVVATLVVSTLLVAALNTLGAAKLSERKAADVTRGVLLAQDLLSEIVQQHYADPDNGADSFGLDGDETGDGSRALWEDVDDYDGWGAAPPQHKDGTVMTDFDGWERRVSVAWVNPDDLSDVVGGNMDAKRVTVTVLYDGVEAAELVAARTQSSDAERAFGGLPKGLDWP